MTTLEKKNETLVTSFSKKYLEYSNKLHCDSFKFKNYLPKKTNFTFYLKNNVYRNYIVKTNFTKSTSCIC